ncbi:MAG: permease [Firmicutes bacterium]|nr:permease [Bacillota bacterium]
MFQTVKGELIMIAYYFELQLKQIAFYWAVGIVIGSVISVFGKQKIHSLMTVIQDKRLGIFGIIPASLIGVASPLCMYGTIPLSAAFSQKGMRDDYLAAFMMSSILLNPQLLIYSAVLCKSALCIRFISCFLCGIAAGLVIRFFFKDKHFFNFDGFTEGASRDTDPNLFIRLLKKIGRNIKATGPYFLIGILLSALFQRYVPQDAFAEIFGKQNKGFGLLMAATIGVPLYACGGGTIPLLQQWLSQGMSMGSATAFMITGPSTKITNLKKMRKKSRRQGHGIVIQDKRKETASKL